MISAVLARILTSLRMLILAKPALTRLRRVLLYLCGRRLTKKLNNQRALVTQFSHGMMVDWFGDAKQGEMALQEGMFDAVLLDLTLPRGDGMTVLQITVEIKN